MRMPRILAIEDAISELYCGGRVLEPKLARTNSAAFGHARRRLQLRGIRRQSPNVGDRLCGFFHGFLTASREDNRQGIALKRGYIENLVHRLSTYLEVAVVMVKIDAVQCFLDWFTFELKMHPATGTILLHKLHIVSAGLNSRSKGDDFRHDLDSAVGLIRGAQRVLKNGQQLKRSLAACLHHAPLVLVLAGDDFLAGLHYCLLRLFAVHGPAPGHRVPESEELVGVDTVQYLAVIGAAGDIRAAGVSR